MSRRDLLNFQGLGRREFDGLLALAAALKHNQRRGIAHRLLAGKSLAMLFEKPSLRTRTTFQTGMSQLGGYVIFLGPAEVGLGTREAPADCARSLARWVDLITVRTFAQKTLEEMARFSSVPVINALTDLYHPCQVLADCQTLLEHRGRLDGLKIVFAGDGNNMVHSWLEAAAIVPFSFTLACPKGFEPDGDILRKARGAGADITVTQSLEDAARDADALYTDVWTSMGQEAEAEARRQAFRAYQVTRNIVALAKINAVVMHCLPAHRGEEITHEVLESPQCVAFDQAENRLHAQKAVMVWLLKGFKGSKVQGSKSPKNKNRERQRARGSKLRP
jgi:ornithine carbamoyltransferase